MLTCLFFLSKEKRISFKLKKLKDRFKFKRLKEFKIKSNEVKRI